MSDNSRFIIRCAGVFVQGCAMAIVFVSGFAVGRDVWWVLWALSGCVAACLLTAQAITLFAVASPTKTLE